MPNPRFDQSSANVRTAQPGPAPRKTITGPMGRSPIKPVVTGGTARYDARPNKTIVGSANQPPIKTVVGSANRPPVKTLVGRTAAPPLKTTPADLGQGGNGPRPRGELDRSPLGSTSPSLNMRSLGNGDGNPGRSVAPTPQQPAPGVPNPVLDWNQPSGDTSVQPGGMGQTPKLLAAIRPRAMGRTARPRKGPKNAFFGE